MAKFRLKIEVIELETGDSMLFQVTEELDDSLLSLMNVLVGGLDNNPKSGGRK